MVVAASRPDNDGILVIPNEDVRTIVGSRTEDDVANQSSERVAATLGSLLSAAPCATVPSNIRAPERRCTPSATELDTSSNGNVRIAAAVGFLVSF